MNIIKLASSTVIIETLDTSILCDPWIENGEYYGSWSLVEEIPNREKFYKMMNECENIYVSHIHPDHFSKKTMKNIDKNKKIFIHSYSSAFLKRNLELMGFNNVIEIENGETKNIKNNTNITIFAADNCDPNMCKKFVGCNYSDNSKKSQQIDSCAVIYDNKKCCVNLNDCMQPMMIETTKKIKKKFNNIDILLVNYNSAHSYPQNILNIEYEKKIKIGNHIKQLNLEKSSKYIKELQPKFFIPFAGEYLISGKKYKLNKVKGTNSQKECFDFFQNSDFRNQLVMLNYGKNFEGNTIPEFKKEKNIDQVEYEKKISKILYEYENLDLPKKEEIEYLSKKAFDNILKKKDIFQINFDHILYIEYYNKFISLDFDKKEIKFQNEVSSGNKDYTILHLNEKLLLNLLKGPRYAHWNNADIGSHIDYTKSNISEYNYKLFNILAYYHS